MRQKEKIKTNIFLAFPNFHIPKSYAKQQQTVADVL